MNADNCELACGLVSGSYIRQGQQALARRQRLVKALLSSRRLPERGWDEATIEMLLRDASAMDSNNFLDNVGVGEREGRVACPLVARRHYGQAHGVGRSGDVAAEQPKAAGSSLLAALTQHLAADALRIAGLAGLGPVSVLPLATGMALTLVLLALRPSRPPGADTVVWSRVDQKTCLKAVTAAGLRPHVLQLRREGDELVTDVQALSEALESLGPDRVLAVVTTTSCFAPRAPDDVVAAARLCAAAGVPHVVNNAYGLQSRATCAALSAAWSRGRVDAVVQSTDKNFMVPVGGAVVAAPAARPGLVAAVNGTYPGRASSAPALDLLMTLLHWGAAGWRKVLADREELLPYLRSQLQAAAARQGERLLLTLSNPISTAISLDTLVAAAAAARGRAAEAAKAAELAAERAAEPETDATSSGPAEKEMAAADGPQAKAEAEDEAAGARGGCGGGEAERSIGCSAGEAAAAAQLPGGAGGAAVSSGPARRAAPQPPDVTFFGAMLWSRCVSGTRVVSPGKTQSVGGVTFRNYGSHTDEAYPCTYLTAAAALGTTRADVDEFVARLERCFAEFRKKCGAVGAGGGKAPAVGPLRSGAESGADVGAEGSGREVGSAAAAAAVEAEAGAGGGRKVVEGGATAAEVG